MELNTQQTIFVVSFLILLVIWVMRTFGPNTKAIYGVIKILENQAQKRNGKIDRSIKGMISMIYPFEDQMINISFIESYTHKHISTPPMITLSCSLTKQISHTFSIYREDAFAKSEKIFGAQDIQIGHEKFDKKFIIKSDNKIHLQSILDIDIQYLLLDFIEYEPEAHLSTKTLHLYFSGIPPDEPSLEKMIYLTESLLRKILINP